MNRPPSAQPAGDPLWLDNAILAHALGLSPLLAVSTQLASGIGLGIATLVVTLAACLTASLCRSSLAGPWRFVAMALILAFYTSILEFLVNIYFYPLYLSLGIYLPLICCNLAIPVAMETRSRHLPWPSACLDGFRTGVGLLLVMVVFSATREWLAHGTLLDNVTMLAPRGGDGPVGTTVSGSRLPFAGMQPGAFILLGLFVAGCNFLGQARATGAGRTAIT